MNLVLAIAPQENKEEAKEEVWDDDKESDFDDSDDFEEYDSEE